MDFCLLIKEQELFSGTVEFLFLVSKIIASQKCFAGIILWLLNFFMRMNMCIHMTLFLYDLVFSFSRYSICI